MTDRFDASIDQALHRFLGGPLVAESPNSPLLEASDTIPLSASAHAVAHALEDLALLPTADTAELEFALSSCILFVAVWPDAGMMAARTGNFRFAEQRTLAGQQRLALFTSVERLALFAGGQGAQVRRLEAASAWALIDALRFDEAVLDPAHEHSRVLTGHLLQRLRRTSVDRPRAPRSA